jgi:hypothetical protein
VRPQDAADVLLAIEHVVVVVRPRAAGTVFGGAFEGEDWRLPAPVFGVSVN